MPEAFWIMRVKEFRPLIVSIDTKGNNLFELNKAEFNRKRGRGFGRYLQSMCITRTINFTKEN